MFLGSFLMFLRDGLRNCFHGKVAETTTVDSKTRDMRNMDCLSRLLSKTWIATPKNVKKKAVDMSKAREQTCRS